MKQVVKGLVLLVAIAVFTFPSKTNAAVIQDVTPNILNTDGLGSVVLGTAADDIPEKEDGLYSSKKVTPNEIIFYDENGNEVFLAIPDENGLISLISVTSPAIMTAEGAHVGMTTQEVENLENVVYIQPDPDADFPRGSYELNGVTLLMDFEDEGIVTEMTVSYVSDNFDLGCEKQKKVHQGLLKYFNLSRTLKDLLRFLNEMMQMEYVKKVYSSGSSIYVEVEDFGTVSYSFYPNIADVDNDDLRKLEEELKRIVGANPNQFKYDDIVVAYQMENDDDFAKQIKDLKEGIKLMFEKSGSQNVTFSAPTVKFFLNDLYNHNFVLLDTHGGYDSQRGVHWLVTSERITNEIAALRKYKKSIQNKLISIDYSCHEKRDGIKVDVPYICVSERLIQRALNHFEYRVPVIVYNTACHSMQGSFGLAESFREKGANLYLGYNKAENVGVYGGLQFFGRLLSGMSVEGAIKSLDDAVVHNISKTPEGEPINAELVYSPEEGTSQYNNFKDYIYVHPDLKEEHRFSFSNMPIKYHLLDANKNDVEGSEIFIQLTYSGTIPLHWYNYPSLRYNSNINGKLSTIPLKYGFQLCKDDEFREGRRRELLSSINDSALITDQDTGEKLVEMRSDYKDGMVVFTMNVNFPISNGFWDNDKERCFIRPVVYDTITKKYNTGPIRLLYKIGGASDPNKKH